MLFGVALALAGCGSSGTSSGESDEPATSPAAIDAVCSGAAAQLRDLPVALTIDDLLDQTVPDWTRPLNDDGFSAIAALDATDDADFEAARTELVDAIQANVVHMGDVRDAVRDDSDASALLEEVPGVLERIDAAATSLGAGGCTGDALGAAWYEQVDGFIGAISEVSDKTGDFVADASAFCATLRTEFDRAPAVDGRVLDDLVTQFEIRRPAVDRLVRDLRVYVGDPAVDGVLLDGVIADLESASRLMIESIADMQQALLDELPFTVDERLASAESELADLGVQCDLGR
jgi:hypothetical protein